MTVSLRCRPHTHTPELTRLSVHFSSSQYRHSLGPSPQSTGEAFHCHGGSGRRTPYLRPPFLLPPNDLMNEVLPTVGLLACDLGSRTPSKHQCAPASGSGCRVGHLSSFGCSPGHCRAHTGKAPLFWRKKNNVNLDVFCFRCLLSENSSLLSEPLSQMMVLVGGMGFSFISQMVCNPEAREL